MKILHLIISVDPKGGGPIEYARIMAEQHQIAGHQSAFVTLDAPHDTCVSEFSFPVYATGPGVGKFSYTGNFARVILEIASSFDIAVIHGLWNYATVGGYAALKLKGVPYVVFTHGMLDPWFRKEKPLKHVLKQLFWTLWQGRVLSGARAVLFTCEEERRLAQGAFLGHSHYDARVVAFCADRQKKAVSEDMEIFLRQLPGLKGRRYILYLSRIHPKKACDQLIIAFAAIAFDVPDLDLVMAGPDEIGWQPHLMQLADALGVGARVHWPGLVQGRAKAAAFYHAEAFILPSHQENFGMVVAEALSCGTPVMISDKVNIWREVEQAGAGLVAQDTVDGTKKMLRDFLAMAPSARASMASAAIALYNAQFSVESAAEDLLAVLKGSDHSE